MNRLPTKADQIKENERQSSNGADSVLNAASSCDHNQPAGDNLDRNTDGDGGSENDLVSSVAGETVTDID
jgi:hypothetical protein